MMRAAVAGRGGDAQAGYCHHQDKKESYLHSMRADDIADGIQNAPINK
jgi:hypothetical protein